MPCIASTSAQEYVYLLQNNILNCTVRNHKKNRRSNFCGGDVSKMVRTYKRTAGTRNYKNYSEETLAEAIQKISDNELSIHAASLLFNIPFETLYNKYKGMHGRTPGAQPVFSHQEEISILKAAATCADWGFPLTTLDLGMFAKSYLDRQGKTIARFKNNLP